MGSILGKLGVLEPLSTGMVASDIPPPHTPATRPLIEFLTILGTHSRTVRLPRTNIPSWLPCTKMVGIGCLATLMMRNILLLTAISPPLVLVPLGTLDLGSLLALSGNLLSPYHMVMFM